MKKNQSYYSVTEVSKIEKLPYHKIIRKIKKDCYPDAYKVGHGWVIPKDNVKQRAKKK